MVMVFNWIVLIIFLISLYIIGKYFVCKFGWKWYSWYLEVKLGVK